MTDIYGNHEMSQLCQLMGRSFSLVLSQLVTLNEKVDLLLKGFSLMANNFPQHNTPGEEINIIGHNSTEISWPSDMIGEGEIGQHKGSKDEILDNGEAEGGGNLSGEQHGQGKDESMDFETGAPKQIMNTSLGIDFPLWSAGCHYDHPFQVEQLAFDIKDFQLNRGRWTSKRGIRRSLAQILSRSLKEIKIKTISWLHKDFQSYDHSPRLITTFEVKRLIEELWALRSQLNSWGITIRRVIVDPSTRPLMPNLPSHTRAPAKSNRMFNPLCRSSSPVNPLSVKSAQPLSIPCPQALLSNTLSSCFERSPSFDRLYLSPSLDTT
ncbi:uncharacterized protein LOC134298474 [Anolis carolinensis]|uniref:uncharacterized protein LOC134298474 n=1 Tax=Anolis carolinensis TaxID=28377 RepID=UPI002F2B4046